MSELKYRVKIIEKNDGTILYVPQVGKVTLYPGRFCFLSYDWRNIIRKGISTEFDKPSKVVTYYYDTEQDVLDIIESYKQHLIKQDSKKVKSITYKEL
jgi:hypothetical protein